MRSLAIALLATFVTFSTFAATDAQLFADGKAAQRKGDTEQAVKLFEQAIAQKPTVAEYHYYLGVNYGSQAQKAGMFGGLSLGKKALAEFLRAVELDPNYLDARLALIDFYMVAPGFVGGDKDKAKLQAAEIKKRDALEGHRAYGRIYNREKKTDLARKEYVDAVREQPTSPKAHLYLGTFYASQKDWANSLHEFEYALKLDPNYMLAWFRLGHHAATSESNYARGEEALRKYLIYTPADNEPSHASTWYYIGMIQEKQGKKADAKQSYLNAQKLAPTSKDVAAALKRVS